MSNRWSNILNMCCITLLTTSTIVVGHLFISASEVGAVDPIDIFKGAVEYIQVANISDEQEVEIGKQTNFW